MNFDLKNYTLRVREDFSVVACPKSMMKIASPHKQGDRDYSNTAEKGYIISPVARRKIKSACISLYARCSREEQHRLRFVTFTFPSLPDWIKELPVQEQDAELHKIFKKFLDNERKPKYVGQNSQQVFLEKYLWINERQDGSRLVNSNTPRNVIHYHCLFRYSFNVDYWLANIRFLNLLFRSGFEIFNKAFLAENYTQDRQQVIDNLNSLNYKWFKDNQLKLKRVFNPTTLEPESIFLQPVDFDKKKIENIENIGKYLSSYLSKDNKEELQKETEDLYIPNNDAFTAAKESFEKFYNQSFSIEQKDEEKEEYKKIYCRRWGASRGLVTPKKNIEEAFQKAFPCEIIWNENPRTYFSEETGEIFYETPESIIIPNDDQVINLYNYDPKDVIPFETQIGKEKFQLFYFPPQFQRWRQIPELRKFFKEYFDYNLY